jgi:hypothetical protein
MSEDYINGGQNPLEDKLDTEKSTQYFVLPGGADVLSGTDITYSSGRGRAVHRVSGDYAGGAGGIHAFYGYLTLSGALTDAGAGIIGVKQVVVNTAHQADGNVYAAQFIAKHAHATNHMHAEACLIGVEAIGYCSAAAGVGVMIGVNAVIRSYATGAYAGGVHRGIQIIVDESTLGADEVTALCIWNMGASAIGGIRFVGADTMANFLYIDAVGGLAVAATRHDSDGADIKCDAYLKCSIGGTEYDIALYNS